MTDKRLAEIEARAAKAAPGPWKYYPGQRGVYSADDRYVCTRAGYMGKLSRQFDDSNMPFITHARDDIPYLLSELRARDAEVARLREALKTAVHFMRNAGVDLDPNYPEIVATLNPEVKP